MENYEKAEQDYMGGMKYKDIAEKYGTTINTVKSWKKRYGWNREKMVQTNVSKVIPLKIPSAIEKEILKEVKGTQGKYIISNLGYVLRRTKNGTYEKVKTSKNNKGYVYFKICLKGKKITVSLHRTVAEYFVANPQGYKEVNHIDEDKSNNNASNLEWCTRQYNNCYGTRLKRQIETRMEVR